MTPAAEFNRTTWTEHLKGAAAMAVARSGAKYRGARPIMW